MPAEQCADRIGEFQEAFTWLHRPDLISIAAVQGHAIGAGFQLALACDLRVVADDAQFAMAEVTLGLVPDLGGTKRLVDLVGYSRALEICVTGRRLDAYEAERLGLANIVVPRRELDAATRDLTAAILASDRDAVIEIKALLAGAAGRSCREQRRAEREAQTRRLRDLAGLGESALGDRALRDQVRARAHVCLAVKRRSGRGGLPQGLTSVLGTLSPTPVARHGGGGVPHPMMDGGLGGRSFLRSMRAGTSWASVRSRVAPPVGSWRSRARTAGTSWSS